MRTRGEWTASLVASFVAFGAVVSCLGERPTPPDPVGTGGSVSGQGGAQGTGGGAGTGGSAGTGASAGNDAQAMGGQGGIAPDAMTSDSNYVDRANTGGNAGSVEGGSPDVGRPDASDAGAPDVSADAPADVVDASGETGGSVATKLVFTTQPQTAFTQTPLQPFKVAFEDANDNLVATATDTITVAISINSGGANLLGYLTATPVNGVATFDTVGLDQAGTGYTLVAVSANFLRGTSQSFDIQKPPFARVSTGIYGGNVTSIAVGGGGMSSILYAGTPAGVYKSTNSGSTWALTNFGNPGEADLVVLDPRNPSIAYVTPNAGNSSYGFGGFLFAGKTTTGGDAWRSIGDTVGTGQIGTFVVDPRNTAIVYAGGPGGIYRSTNGGDDWTKTNFGYRCYALTIDPINPTTLYAHAYDGTTFTPQGIQKSIDSGTTWAPVNNPALTPSNLSISGLFATPTGVFASTGTSMFRSTDGGASWTAMSTPGWMVAYAPSSVQRVYLGRGSTIQVSTDGGASFGVPVTVGGTLNSLAVDPSNANVVYAATSNGVFASTDGGSSFNASSIGLDLPTVGSVAMNPGLTNTIFAGGPDSIYRTIDSATTWSRINVGEPVTALAVDPANTRSVYACTLGAKFYRSIDSGVNFTLSDTGGGLYCYNIAVHGSTLWVSTVGGGVRRSIDSGATWNATMLTAPTYAVTADPSGNTVYAGTNGGTYKSIDGGQTWNVMVGADLAEALLVDPVTSTTLYAGLGCGTGAGGADSSGGIRRSIDSGMNWGQPVGNNCINSMLGLASGTLFSLTRSGTPLGISTDHGATWMPAGIGIAGEPFGIAASSDARTLYVGSALGLYKSVTGGL